MKVRIAIVLALLGSVLSVAGPAEAQRANGGDVEGEATIYGNFTDAPAVESFYRYSFVYLNVRLWADEPLKLERKDYYC
ncbi:MAG TPA: hypothetical protein VNB24_05050, partial [Acidimicrobiales bacterium]|nr:hypothetical protein [Acidimicrobiales bacterium]